MGVEIESVEVEATEKLHVLVVGQPGGPCEPFLRRLLAPGDWKVSYCISVSEAEDVLVATRTDLVITDLRVEDGCGLSLLAVREDLGGEFPILLATPPEAQVREIASSPLRWLRSPLDTGSIGDLIAAEKRELAALGGRRMRVGDHLYAAAVTRQTVALYFRFEDGAEAVLEVVDGELWSCSHEESDGLRPLVSLLAVEPRQARTDPLSRRPEIRRLKLDTQEWILRAFGERPAGGKVETRPIGPLAPEDIEPSTAPPSEVAATDFEALFVAGVAASLARDYAGALEAFARAERLSPGDSRVRFNLERVRRKLDHA